MMIDFDCADQGEENPSNSAENSKIEESDQEAALQKPNDEGSDLDESEGKSDDSTSNFNALATQQNNIGSATFQELLALFWRRTNHFVANFNVGLFLQNIRLQAQEFLFRCFQYGIFNVFYS